jgi:hypothetical protein
MVDWTRAVRTPALSTVASRRAREQPEAALLVDAGIDVDADVSVKAFVLGSDPYDERITCLADVRGPETLPPGRFDMVALVDARSRRASAAVENAFRALRPGGVLVCGATWPVAGQLRRRFDEVRGRGIGPWRVFEARRVGDGDG